MFLIYLCTMLVSEALVFLPAREGLRKHLSGNRRRCTQASFDSGLLTTWRMQSVSVSAKVPLAALGMNFKTEHR